jgi:lipopolysaccharide transport system permease protein
LNSAAETAPDLQRAPSPLPGGAAAAPFPGQGPPAPAEPTAAAQDDLPETVIEARPGWHIVNFKEVWRYRELLVFLTWRDIKVRYKQTVLGALWALLQPLATMIVFVLFLGNVAGITTHETPYPLFVLAGTIAWTFFANAVTTAGSSIVGSQNLVTKVYFPRLIIPMGAVGAGLVDFLVACALYGVVMAWYGLVPGWGIILAPLIFLFLVIAALGVGTLLAALTVAYRDFRYVVPFGVQLWMFATPCIYIQSEQIVGPRGQAWLPLNPAYGLIYNFRQCLLGGPLDIYALWVSAAVSVGLLVLGCMYFRRVERSFADVI